MGHVGLLPQSISVLGGFRPQGQSGASAIQVLQNAKVGGSLHSLLHQPYKYYRTPRWVDHYTVWCISHTSTTERQGGWIITQSAASAIQVLQKAKVGESLCRRECYSDVSCCNLRFSYHCVYVSPCTCLDSCLQLCVQEQGSSQSSWRLTRTTAVGTTQQSLQYCQAARHATASNAVKHQ